MNEKEKEAKWVVEGLVKESYPSGMFRVQLDNGDRVLGYISGKIRRNFIRILPGDRVQIEISRYDSTKGRIIFRLPPIPKPKDSDIPKPKDSDIPKPKDSEDDSKD
uniref:Translational initiation factor n=1 Tax=Chrysojasminum floridum TaxID=485365 RepID=UPI002E7A95A4|nr:Translational initiation factor [Chrysojasminum floridum]WPN86959.1 Translational initiation factor [Chrysojasminum floridum]